MSFIGMIKQTLTLPKQMSKYSSKRGNMYAVGGDTALCKHCD